jgi:hypothetical protein
MAAMATGSRSPGTSRTSSSSSGLAPLYVPWERRKQTAAALLWTLLQPFVMAPLCVLVTAVACLNPLLAPVVAAYVVWAVWFGSSCPSRVLCVRRC